MLEEKECERRPGCIEGHWPKDRPHEAQGSRARVAPHHDNRDHHNPNRSAGDDGSHHRDRIGIGLAQPQPRLEQSDDKEHCTGQHSNKGRRACRQAQPLPPCTGARDGQEDQEGPRRRRGDHQPDHCKEDDGGDDTLFEHRVQRLTVECTWALVRPNRRSRVLYHSKAAFSSFSPKSGQ